MEFKKLVAFLCLVVVNVCLSLLITLSKRDGQTYDYNPASAITLAESAKFALSIVTYLREKDPNEMWTTNVSVMFVFSYFALALIYCLNNQLTFTILSLTNPGNLTLFKSTTPFLTALLQLVVFGTQFTKLRWTSVVILSSGLLLTQWDDCSSSLHINFEAYVALLTSVLLTSLSSVVNARTIKVFSSAPLSLHNSVLYFFGIIFNANTYVLGKAGVVPINSDASFLEGYDNIYAILVILLNSMIGIIITALYKYGDAVTKCFAQVLSSIILVIISFMFFDYKMSVSSSSGCLSVFVASYIYLILSPEIETNSDTKSHLVREKSREDTSEGADENEMLIDHAEGRDSVEKV